ncbi:MAG: MipA/OmpV family protein [Pseudomonadota bacterium]
MNTKSNLRLAIALFGAISIPAIAHAGEDVWSFSVGLGTVYAPTYLGDDVGQLSFAPNLSVKYGDTFFASLGEGIGYNVINSGGWRVGPVVKYHFGRDEDGDNLFAVTGDDTQDLVGLGDVDGTVELGGFVEYSIMDFTGKVELRQGVGGHEGFIGEAEVKYGTVFGLFGQQAIFSFGPEVAFGDGNYNSAFFDVNAVQSAASGLPVFDAGGGLISYGIGGSLVVPVTDSVSVISFASYDQLTGDVADSSLVRLRGSENQSTLGMFLNYSF